MVLVEPVRTIVLPIIIYIAVCLPYLTDTSHSIIIVRLVTTSSSSGDSDPINNYS